MLQPGQSIFKRVLLCFKLVLMSNSGFGLKVAEENCEIARVYKEIPFFIFIHGI